MKTEKRILAAFILNASFSVFELIGGFLTGSVTVTSDSLHDAGDAVAIGISYFLERKSKRPPDEKYSFGYARFSLLGSVITTVILLAGATAVACGAVLRIIFPREIDAGGMIIFAVIGIIVNAFAVLLTHGGRSLNQRAVSLHMVEDVLGWASTLVGAVVIKLTGITVIDSVMSLVIAALLSVAALKNLKSAAEVFLLKTPNGLSPERIKKDLEETDGVTGVHHLHLWSVDGTNTAATVHIKISGDFVKVKAAVREKLCCYGVDHVTVEAETADEICSEVCPIALEVKKEGCRHGHSH